MVEVRANIPRLLALIDSDVTSATYGVGDRYHWAWGLIDFGNGTFQGMANGLARLWCHRLWPYATSKELFFNRIDSLFQGARKITRPDGSLEEAFPHEGSYCVTALVAFDLLVAYDLLKDQVDHNTKQRWLEIIDPMIRYLMHSKETHAIISNHLATAVAALVRWHVITKEYQVETRARELLDQILKHQSQEGWFKEYEGADPGYQSLCTCYLADVHKLRPDWGLLDPLRRSIQFLWHFAHPDGSFGGVYGSRCTRFYYPPGILALSGDIPEAAALADFMGRSISNQKVVTLSAIDEPNLIPTFNAYCWAASLVGQIYPRPPSKTIPTIPALRSEPSRVIYNSAGILIDSGEGHYTIVAMQKGGVVYHFKSRSRAIVDTGVVVRNAKGRLGSSQNAGKVLLELDQEKLTVLSPITSMPKQRPGPWQFICLRLMCVTIFRVPRIRERIKQMLVRFLITGYKPWPVENQRIIHLGENLRVEDKTLISSGYEVMKEVREFIPIHMASQGYWQLQDELKDEKT